MSAAAHFLAHVRFRQTLSALSGRRVRRKPGRLPAQAQPNAIRLAYATALIGVIRELRDRVLAALRPELPGLVAAAGLVHDAVGPLGYAAELHNLVERTGAQFFSEFTNERLRRLALQMGERTATHQKVELNRQLAAVFGPELGINPFTDKGITERLNAFAVENAALIKKTSQAFLDDVATASLRALRMGRRSEEVAKEIEARGEVSEGRARLIARDQIGKLTSQLNQARQQSLGIDRFTWSTSADERLCDECGPLDGKTFAWDDPPEEGLPGEVHPNCRCVGVPVLQDLFDSL